MQRSLSLDMKSLSIWKVPVLFLMIITILSFFVQVTPFRTRNPLNRREYQQIYHLKLIKFKINFELVVQQMILRRLVFKIIFLLFRCFSILDH